MQPPMFAQRSSGGLKVDCWLMLVASELID
jgi:hypothetical protein